MQKLSNPFAGNQIAGGREYQEDAFKICDLRNGKPKELLLLLADGMGGHVGGARASALVVATFAESFADSNTNNDIEQRLRESLDAANVAIATDTEANPQYAEMGCTLLACLVSGNELHWLSVGDSPLWILHGKDITRLNADHSMRPLLQDLVELGRMSAEELAEDHRVSQLRSAVTGEDLSLVDQNTSPYPLAVNDQIILASDGVETLMVDEISHLCQEQDSPEQVVTALLDDIEARQVPRQDNATVVAYRHQDTNLVAPDIKHQAPREMPVTEAMEAITLVGRRRRALNIMAPLHYVKRLASRRH